MFVQSEVRFLALEWADTEYRVSALLRVFQNRYIQRGAGHCIILKEDRPHPLAANAISCHVSCLYAKSVSKYMDTILASWRGLSYNIPESLSNAGPISDSFRRTHKWRARSGDALPLCFWACSVHFSQTSRLLHYFFISRDKAVLSFVGYLPSVSVYGNGRMHQARGPRQRRLYQRAADSVFHDPAWILRTIQLR